MVGRLRLSVPPSQVDTEDFFEWWQRISDMVGKEAKRGLNSVIILGAWTIWTVRNGVVFNGVLPRVSQAITITLARDEAELFGC